MYGGSRRRSQRLQEGERNFCNLPTRVPHVQRLTFGILSPPNSPSRTEVGVLCGVFGKFPNAIPLALPRPICPLIFVTRRLEFTSSVAPSVESSPSPPEKKLKSPCAYSCAYTPNGSSRSMDALLHVISRVSPASTRKIPIPQFTPVCADFREIASSIMSRPSSPIVTEEMKTKVASAFATATMDMEVCPTAPVGIKGIETKIVQLSQPEVSRLSLFRAGFRAGCDPILFRSDRSFAQFAHSHSSHSRISHNVHDSHFVKLSRAAGLGCLKLLKRLKLWLCLHLWGLCHAYGGRVCNPGN